MDDQTTQLGELIRSARLRAGLTQVEFAVSLDATPAGVSRWENGHARPSLKKRRLLAEKFGLRLTHE